MNQAPEPLEKRLVLDAVANVHDEPETSVVAECKEILKKRKKKERKD